MAGRRRVQREGSSVPESDDILSKPPINIGQTLEAIARLHAEHRAGATRHERVVAFVTSLLNRPSFLISLTLVVVGWIGLNILAPTLGFRPPDPPPFAWLSGFSSLASLYLVVVIVTTQRRDDRLARHRELLTLELAILTEQKTTKAIALLEELRRDSPHVHDRVDEQADFMAKPADPRTVVEAIHETRTAAAHLSNPGV
jgi:uncharacterized membrane protein